MMVRTQHGWRAMGPQVEEIRQLRGPCCWFLTAFQKPLQGELANRL